MTWNSACSVTSDDENSCQSFLSDCDSEFDLQPPPRYPAEKRSYIPQSISPIEPPMTRSRAKAIGKTILPFEPLPKPRRRSAIRRSIDAFTGMASTLTSSLSNNNNSILFPKHEPITLSNDRLMNAPLDGVNILADRFESCSLDEEKLSRNCLWPSRETNSHYMRPITTLPRTNQFPSTSFSALNNSSLFAQSSTPILFGQQQAQLWSRFRFAASTLRNNNLWLEQADLTLQQVPSTIFPTHINHNSSSMLLSPQTVPNRLVDSQNQSSPFTCAQREIASSNESILPTSIKDNVIIQQSFMSKMFFSFTIFAIGLVLGYVLTNTLPPVLVWETCVKYIHLLWIYIQTIFDHFESLRST